MTVEQCRGLNVWQPQFESASVNIELTDELNYLLRKTVEAQRKIEHCASSMIDFEGRLVCMWKLGGGGCWGTNFTHPCLFALHLLSQPLNNVVCGMKDICSQHLPTISFPHTVKKPLLG